MLPEADDHIWVKSHDTLPLRPFLCIPYTVRALFMYRAATPAGRLLPRAAF